MKKLKAEVLMEVILQERLNSEEVSADMLKMMIIEVVVQEAREEDIILIDIMEEAIVTDVVDIITEMRLTELQELTT